MAERMNNIMDASAFLEELRKLIPDIPDPRFTKNLSIHISKGHATLVKCEFYVRSNGSPELHSKTFRLVEVEESVPHESEPVWQDCDAVSVDPESDVPSKEAVLEFLREAVEDDPEFAAQQTSDLANYYNVDHLKLYNHDACTGPLYELLQDGLVMRMVSNSRNPESGDEWEWVATGAKIVWDK